MKADERKRLATEIAKMYYLEDLSQDEISKKVQMSRANVSRILRKCVENGVVEIVIHDTETLRPELAQKIKMHYGLVDVIIAPTTTELTNNRGTTCAIHNAYCERWHAIRCRKRTSKLLCC